MNPTLPRISLPSIEVKETFRSFTEPTTTSSQRSPKTNALLSILKKARDSTTSSYDQIMTSPSQRKASSLAQVLNETHRKFASPIPQHRENIQIMTPNPKSPLPSLQKAMTSPIRPIADTSSHAANVQGAETILDKANKKTANIDRIIEKQRSKLRFIKKDKTQIFDEKMLKAFGKLRTYLNIKDTIQEMNILNRKPVVLNLSKTEPQIKTDNPLQKLRNKVNKIIIANKTFRMKTSKLNTSDSNEGTSPKRGLRAQRSFLGRLVEQQNYEEILEMTTQKLAEGTQSSFPQDEENDVDVFFTQLEDSLVNNKFDREQLEEIHMAIEDPSKIAYYKSLLEYRPTPTIDDKYYHNYKKRVDKVISVLKKQTKRIFNKVVDYGRKPKYSGASQKQVESDQKFKDTLRKSIKTFVTSQDLLDESPSKRKDLKTQFGSMIRKVETLEVPRLSADWAPQSDRNQLQINKDINKAYKQFMKNIIDEANTQQSEHRTNVAEFKKQIVDIENAFQKEMDSFFPDDMESLRITIDKTPFADGAKTKMRIPKYIMTRMLGLNVKSGKHH